jgi:hypothetical protein
LVTVPFGSELRLASAPSVVTLNGLSAAQAANDFQMYMTGLTRADAFQGNLQQRPLERRVRFVTPRRDIHCLDCGHEKHSRMVRGDKADLPLID